MYRDTFITYIKEIMTAYISIYFVYNLNYYFKILTL